jgi:hypothetical protein
MKIDDEKDRRYDNRRRKSKEGKEKRKEEHEEKEEEFTIVCHQILNEPKHPTTKHVIQTERIISKCGRYENRRRKR